MFFPKLAAGVLSAVFGLAACRTTDADNPLKKDIEALKKDVARVAARQESMEKDLNALRAERKDAGQNTPPMGVQGSAAKDRVVTELRVPPLKVVKVKDEGTARKQTAGKASDPVSTTDRPFGDAGPDVNDEGAVVLGNAAAIQGATVRE